MSKINSLLQAWPKNAVATAKWLVEQGVGYDLRRSYKKSGWILPFGNGATIRPNDRVTWEGGLHALQYQLHKDIHVGGRSALERKGEGHYVRMENAPLYLFVRPHMAIEKWFTDHDWGKPLHYIRTNVVGSDVGVEEETVEEFKIKVSSAERAILEMLCFTPEYFSFSEASNIMEHLSWLRSDLVQELLKNCTSYKGKRLFLVLGEYYNHPWIHKLDMSKIDLGKGKLSLFKGGTFNAKYRITLPKDLKKNDETPLF